MAISSDRSNVSHTWCLIYSSKQLLWLYFFREPAHTHRFSISKALQLSTNLVLYSETSTSSVSSRSGDERLLPFAIGHIYAMIVWLYFTISILLVGILVTHISLDYHVHLMADRLSRLPPISTVDPQRPSREEGRAAGPRKNLSSGAAPPESVIGSRALSRESLFLIVAPLR